MLTSRQDVRNFISTLQEKLVCLLPSKEVSDTDEKVFE